MDERLLNIDDLAGRLGVCTMTVRRLVTGGKLPRPISLGRAQRWLASDLDKHLRELSEKSSAKRK